MRRRVPLSVRCRLQAEEETQARGRRGLANRAGEGPWTFPEFRPFPAKMTTPSALPGEEGGLSSASPPPHPSPPPPSLPGGLECMCTGVGGGGGRCQGDRKGKTDIRLPAGADALPSSLPLSVLSIHFSPSPSPASSSLLEARRDSRLLPPKKLQATEWEEGAEGHKDRPIGVFRGVDEGKGMPNRRVGGGCLWASSVLSQSRSSGLPAS